MTTESPDRFELSPGSELEIVKLRPDGSQAATYPGTLVEYSPEWVVARASWKFPRMEFDYMTFDPGDYLYEYFATTEPFNAFVLFSQTDEFKGWYCNVTYPTTVSGRSVIWHDLYLDVVQKADGTILLLDEDELADSGIINTDPELHGMIVDAGKMVVEKMRHRTYPFSEFASVNG